MTILDEDQIRALIRNDADGNYVGKFEYFNPMDVDEHADKVAKHFELRVGPFETSTGPGYFAEYGDFYDMSAVYASYVAPYSEFQDRNAARRFAICHTAARAIFNIRNNLKG